MSFFSHLTLYLPFSLLAGPKALSERKKVPENFCPGKREDRQLSLHVAWESIRYGSILHGARGLCGTQSSVSDVPQCRRTSCASLYCPVFNVRDCPFLKQGRNATQCLKSLLTAG